MIHQSHPLDYIAFDRTMQVGQFSNRVHFYKFPISYQVIRTSFNEKIILSQDLVYKIVPDLESDEYKRERKFYTERGLPCPKDQALEQESEEKRAAEAEAAMTPDANTNMDFHRFDEQVSIFNYKISI